MLTATVITFLNVRALYLRYSDDSSVYRECYYVVHVKAVVEYDSVKEKVQAQHIT